MEKSERSIAEIMEEVHRSDPAPIFLGAIFMKHNNLHMQFDRFYTLFKIIKDGEFPYPESMVEKIESVELRDRGHYIESEQIESMFSRLCVSGSIQWYDRVTSRASDYQLTDKATLNFLNEYQDDYEALEFFERCGDYLEIKDE